tara:strand:+ start:516 stop:740 length:225 start_codon:yes stop_codon:yes gene_type:complete
MSKTIRAEQPHKARIRFAIDIFPMGKDGSLHPTPVSAEELTKYGITDFAEIFIDGIDKHNCIKNLISKLESLNG